MAEVKFCTALYCFLVLVFVLVTVSNSAPASNVKHYELTPQDKDDLMRYARNTWKYMEAVVDNPTGIPFRKMPVSLKRIPPAGTITTIANYLWSVIVARDLKLTSPDEALKKVRRTLLRLNKMERNENVGHFYKVYDANTGRQKNESGNQHVSSDDSGMLAASLTLIKGAFPEVHDEAEALLQSMDFNLLRYNGNKYPDRAGLFCRYVGYKRGMYYDSSNCDVYKFVNGETRMPLYIGIGRGQIKDREVYFKLFRTKPPLCNADVEMYPEGYYKQYMGVNVYEGHYKYRNMKIVPTYDGTMFQALAVPLFVPEVEWGPKSWAINHLLYAKAQVLHGMEDAKYGVWGFSSCSNPSERKRKLGYASYGVDALGIDPDGSYSNNDKTAVDYGFPRDKCPNTVRPPQPDPPSSKYTNGVVTPYAIFIALPFVPQEAMTALRKLERKYRMFGEFGFYDSVNVDTSELSSMYQTIDQGKIMAAIGNALTNNSLHRYFASDPGMREYLKPLLEMEEFTAGYSTLDE